MILSKLTLKDFRQFKGTQEIIFAGGTQQNVTVILGENGRGKTGIFRAIMFSLYGDRSISQDENVAIDELFLVNSASLEETLAKNGEPVETYVELEFTHKEERFVIKRTILGMIAENKRLEQLDSVHLSHWKKDGNTENIKDHDKINQIINNILNSNVKEYFLFDGEKIQRLTLSSIDQKREVSRGIRNLLGIDALEKAIRSLQKLSKNLNIELSKKATGEYGKVVHLLNERQEQITTTKSKTAELEKEYIQSDIEKKKIDQKLEDYKEIFHLLKDRKTFEENLKSEEEHAKVILSEMKTKTGKASLLLVSNTIDNVFAAIDEKKQKGEIPSEIRKDLIERILLENRCICGRDILSGTEPFEEIIRWKNRTADVEIVDSALYLWSQLNIIKSHRDDTSGMIETILMKYGQCNNTIEDLRQKLEHINGQIGTSERKDAVHLENHRENIHKKQIKIEAEKMKLEEELDSLDQEYKQLLGQRKLLEQQENIKNELSQRVNLAETAQDALQNIYQQFTNDIKKRISDEANTYFAKLLDKEGRETLRQIIVKDDYSLQIHDKWGKQFLANISAGQRQIMSISFIAALAKVAAPNSTLEMPLFMDTPFSRLSSEHRKNLLEQLPSFGSQLIVLVTDTEFLRKEALLLKNNGTWGRFYSLRGAGPGITTIKENNIDTAQLMLFKDTEN